MKSSFETSTLTGVCWPKRSKRIWWNLSSPTRCRVRSDHRFFSSLFVCFAVAGQAATSANRLEVRLSPLAQLSWQRLGGLWEDGASVEKASALLEVWSVSTRRLWFGLLNPNHRLTLSRTLSAEDFILQG